jgi:ectoine hydroxylase-related dioxygenase (phytanoyl-CoA dioxygenase family)
MKLIDLDQLHAQFTEQGYAVIKQAVPESVVQTVDDAVKQLPVDRSGDLRHRSFNANPALMQVRNAANLMPEYQLLFECPDLMAVIGRILSGSVQVLGSEALRRDVYDEAHEVWHRDSGAYLERPYDDANGPLHLKAQVFLTSTQAMGSGNIAFLPGSHRWPVDHQDGAYWEAADAALAEGTVGNDAVVIHADPGDAVVFGNTLWHAVLPNRVQERRSAIIRFGQAWLRPYDHASDPDTAPDHLSLRSRTLLGYYSAGTNPVDMYKEATAALAEEAR